MELPDELKRYLLAVRESNQRIVETKRRQLDPNLTDDDAPWLVAEQLNMAAQISGFGDYFGGVVLGDDGEVLEGDPAAGEAQAYALFQQLVVEDPADWSTWEDVLSAAEQMNATIDSLLE